MRAKLSRQSRDTSALPVRLGSDLYSEYMLPGPQARQLLTHHHDTKRHTQDRKYTHASDLLDSWLFAL